MRDQAPASTGRLVSTFSASLDGGLSGALFGALLVASACAEEPRTYSTPGAEATPIFRDDFDRADLGPGGNVHRLVLELVK